VQKAYLGGDDFADIIFDLPLWVRGMTTSGYLTRLDTLDYLDLEKPWWDQNQIEATRLANKTFYLTGDLSLSDDQWTTILFFNKDMAIRHNMELPYEMVKEGKWTFDVFMKMASTVYEDTNANGEVDQDDITGIIRTDGYSNWLAAAGNTTVRMDKDGKLYDDFLHDNTFTIMETIDTFLRDEHNALPWGKLDPAGSGLNIYTFSRTLFTSGNLLFAIAAPGSAVEFRDMEENYGMLPMPKWNEEQENYYCPVDGNLNVAFIPATCKTPDQSAFIMEAMAYESMITLTPAYNETLVQRKYSRDEESSEMFPIIKASRYHSTAGYYGISGFEFISSAELPQMSDYAANKEKIQTSIDNIYEKYMKLE